MCEEQARGTSCRPPVGVLKGGHGGGGGAGGDVGGGAGGARVVEGIVL